jgi:hypothetical protein
VKARTSRRRFLQAGIATSTAALAAPWLLPAAARGANDRIVLGGIGVGNQGGSSGPRLLAPMPIAAIADVYLPRAREVAAAVGAKDAYQDYRQLLERRHRRRHRGHSAALARVELHPRRPGGQGHLLRKTVDLLDRRRAAGRRSRAQIQRVLQTGSQQRSGSQEYTGCTYVRNGAIGRVTRVLASNYHSPMEPLHPAQEIPDGLDWDMWCGPAEPPPYNFVIWDNRSDPSWVSIRPFSGGEMTDWGSHGLDMAQWGLGMDESGPVEVWTEGEPFKSLASTPERPGGRHRGPGRRRC